MLMLWQIMHIIIGVCWNYFILLNSHGFVDDTSMKRWEAKWSCLGEMERHLCLGNIAKSHMYIYIHIYSRANSYVALAKLWAVNVSYIYISTLIHWKWWPSSYTSHCITTTLIYVKSCWFYKVHQNKDVQLSVNNGDKNIRLFSSDPFTEMPTEALYWIKFVQSLEKLKEHYMNQETIRNWESHSWILALWIYNTNLYEEIHEAKVRTLSSYNFFFFLTWLTSLRKRGKEDKKHVLHFILDWTLSVSQRQYYYISPFANNLLVLVICPNFLL